MDFVLDASISAVWALADEADPLADQILSNWAGSAAQRDTAWVPSLWWFEIRNILVMSERRKRLSADGSDAFLKLVVSFPIMTDAAPDEAAILRYARRHQLTFYDASYPDVAVRRGLILATLDKALVQAALAEGVTLYL